MVHTTDSPQRLHFLSVRERGVHIIKINKHSQLPVHWETSEEHKEYYTHKTSDCKRTRDLHLYFNKEIGLRRFEHITCLYRKSPTTWMRCKRYVTNLWLSLCDLKSAHLQDIVSPVRYSLIEYPLHNNQNKFFTWRGCCYCVVVLGTKEKTLATLLLFTQYESQFCFCCIRTVSQ
jgi:hypothetical protein